MNIHCKSVRICNRIKPMKKLLLILVTLFSLFATQLQAQRPGFIKRYINKLINDTTDITNPQLIVYPTLAFAPETSWEFGLSSLYVYYAQRDTNNRLSEVNGFAFYTLENQYGIWFDHALYAHKNRWSFIGRLRYQNFPLLYHGIGPETPPDYIARVDARQLNIKERVLKKITNNLFAGPEVDFQRLSSVNFEPHGRGTIVKPLGSEGSSNLGF